MRFQDEPCSNRCQDPIHLHALITAMMKNETHPEHPINRRHFIGCAAATGLSLLATGSVEAQDAPDNSSALETAVKSALKEERSKAFVKRVQHEARYLRPLVDEYGESSLEILRKTTIEPTRESYANRQLERRDLQAVKELLWDNLDAEKYEIEKIEDTETTLEYRVTGCVHADAWRAENAGDIGFAVSCCWDFGFCQGLNPAIKFTRTKTLMQGDCCCNHRYEI